MIKIIEEAEIQIFNKLAPHILQITIWGEFLKSTGKQVVYLLQNEEGTSRSYLVSFNPIPYTKKKIAYLQKCAFPTKDLIQFIKDNYKDVAFIKFEPQLYDTHENRQNLLSLGLRKSSWNIFIENTFYIDLLKPIDEILKNFEGNIKRNIKKAQKNKIKIDIRTDKNAIEDFLILNQDTTKRKVYFTHSDTYYRKMWEVMHRENAAIIFASFNNEYIGAVVLFYHNDMLYNPYSASKTLHNQTGAMAYAHFNAIMYGQKMGKKIYDLWGCLGENPDKKNPLYGVHTFKQGFSGELIAFTGAYDYIFDKKIYYLFHIAAYVRKRYYYIIKKIKYRK